MFNTIAERDLAESLCVREGLYRDLVRVDGHENERELIKESAITNEELLRHFSAETVDDLFAAWMSCLDQFSGIVQHIPSDRVSVETLFSYLESFPSTEYPVVAKVLKVCRNSSLTAIRKDPNGLKNAKKDLYHAEECIKPASFDDTKTSVYKEPQQAIVIVGKFLASVLPESDASKRVIWQAITEVVAEAELELVVHDSDYSEFVQIFYSVEEDELLEELHNRVVCGHLKLQRNVES